MLASQQLPYLKLIPSHYVLQKIVIGIAMHDAYKLFRHSPEPDQSCILVGLRLSIHVHNSRMNAKHLNWRSTKDGVLSPSEAVSDRLYRL
jgi:hypothetical protein